MSEHMAFKGTRVIGTTDWAKEGPALEKMDAAYMAWQKARDTHGTDPKELEKLQKAFEDSQTEAQQYVKPNEFDELVSREGGVGMNAGTSSDATTYYYSLPANKFELFAYLESERFSTPVFREFYKERDVVIEERRLRTESQPTGRLIERFIAAAFIAHPYSNAPIGHRSDLERYTMSDSKAFFDKYYAPANLVTAIVGGIKAKEIIPVIDKYFGRIPARPKPDPLRTIEPPGGAETVNGVNLSVNLTKGTLASFGETPEPPRVPRSRAEPLVPPDAPPVPDVRSRARPSTDDVSSSSCASRACKARTSSRSCGSSRGSRSSSRSCCSATNCASSCIGSSSPVSR